MHTTFKRAWAKCKSSKCAQSVKYWAKIHASPFMENHKMFPWLYPTVLLVLLFMFWDTVLVWVIASPIIAASVFFKLQKRFAA